MNRKNWIKSITMACLGFCLTREARAASKRTVTTEKLCGDGGMEYAAKAFAAALKQLGIDATVTWVNDAPHRYYNVDGTVGTFRIEITT